MRSFLFAPLSALALGAVFALPARAEEGPDQEMEELRQQVQKVLRLMQANEEALLKASVKGGAAPKGPDVPLPPAPDGGAAGGEGTGGQGTGGQATGGQGSGGQGSGSPRGDEAQRALEDILRALDQGGESIPKELEALIKMMPT
jgi:hypothetical protein